ncbi:MAG: hypothetical protein GEV11_29660 [Streptosporangiales bacterium]|nr:hypothetical protein [Streptosporangiales bacterium]
MSGVVDWCGDEDDHRPLSFLGRALPCSFRLRVLVVAPGGVHPYDADDWPDAIVVVERGRIELCEADGSRLGLVSGGVVWLTGLQLSFLRNPGGEPAVITAVSRTACHP